MSKFHVVSRSKSGQISDRFIDASSEDALINQLVKDGHIILEVKEQDESSGSDIIFKIQAWFGLNTPSLTDMSVLSRQLNAMTRSGVPIVQAILLVAESCRNPMLQDALKKVKNSVEAGKSLSQSLGQFPEVFPKIMVVLVNVGENTGKLDEVFAQLSGYFDRELGTKRRIQEATRYPLMVIIAVVIAIGVVNLMVIPSFELVFQKFGADLPWQTKILMTVSKFCVNYWAYIVIGSSLGIYALMHYLNTERGRYQWDYIKLKVPIIGSILQKSLLARFVYAFSLSMRTGIPILETITLIAKTTDNTYVSEKILWMRGKIEHGESLTNAARLTGMFTPLILQMMAVGEQSGDLDRLMEEVGRYYDQEIEYELKSLSSAIEPILIAIIAGIVLILALGIFLPMWNLTSVMTKQ